jgi:hypothetical protein
MLRFPVHLKRKIKKKEQGLDRRGLSRTSDGCGPRHEYAEQLKRMADLAVKTPGCVSHKPFVARTASG